MPADPDVLLLLARRAPLLASLRDGPHSKRDIAATQDVSRSTIDRAVRELESAGLVTRDQEGVALTLPGSLALDAHERYTAALDGIDVAFDILSHYDHDVELPAELFRDATVVPPDRHAPHRPVDALLDMIADADHIRLYATGIMPEYVDAYKERVMEGTTLDLICTDHVFEELVGAYEGDLDEAMTTGRVELSRTATALPFSLIITESGQRTAVCLMFYRDHAVAGFVKNETPGAVEWAIERFSALKAGAELVSEEAA